MIEINKTGVLIKSNIYITLTRLFKFHKTARNFYPSPATFDKPLVFDMVLEGVDLSGVDPNSLNFMYLAPDGTYEAVQYNNIAVNVDKGILEVDDAIIPHFSKYGWCR